MTPRGLAILDLLHHCYHPPASSHPEHDRQWQLWTARYLARLDAAERLFAAVAAVKAGTNDGASDPVSRPSAP